MILQKDKKFVQRIGADVIQKVVAASQGAAIGGSLMLYKGKSYRIVVYNEELFNVTLTGKKEQKL